MDNHLLGGANDWQQIAPPPPPERACSDCHHSGKKYGYRGYEPSDPQAVEYKRNITSMNLRLKKMTCKNPLKQM